MDIIYVNLTFKFPKIIQSFENLVDSKEIKPVNPKVYQLWIFTGKTDAEVEAPVRWPPDVKSQLIGKTLILEKTEGR